MSMHSEWGFPQGAPVLFRNFWLPEKKLSRFLKAWMSRRREEFDKDGKKADAKKSFGLMGVSVKQGMKITVQAEGVAEWKFIMGKVYSAVLQSENCIFLTRKICRSSGNA
ncbi:MAG: HPr family phosphocarrier protein [Lachnospiraceae bacterium]|nr:HPr family phosphocarrier protein [Lachnospiraceae bacterium]